MANCCRPAVRLLRGWAWTVCLLATASAARAQVPFDSWTIEDGLPQNSVNDIRQTRDGYLWLATFGGLVRFDGLRFVVFDRSVDGIGSLRIRTLREDRTGTLWAGTEDGMLIRHRDGRFRTFTGDDGLPQEVALRIDEDEAGRLWVTWQGTVTRIEGTGFVNFAAGDFPRGVRHRAEPPSLGRSVVWWSQDEQGLHCLLAGRVVTCLPPGQLPQGGVRAVTRDFAGTLWVQGARGEVVQITAGGRQRRLSTRDGLPADDGAVSFFHEDREGSIWNARRTGHVYRITQGRRELATPLLLSIHEDREGSIWIGTTGGLHRVRRPTISQRTVREGLSSNNVYSILRDRRGDVWAGTWGSGLNRSVRGRFIAYRVAHGLPSDYITAVYEDPSGRLWVGTTRGLAYLQGNRFHASGAASPALSGSIWAMHQDRAGRFWFATERGLVCLQGEQFTTYTAAHGLADSRVMALHEDRTGALWVGTARGLTRFHEGAFASYTEREGFVGNYVRAFHEDAEGVLWIGTYDGGLYRLARGRLTRYTTQTGLHDNGVFQILDDGSHFWIGSNRGIARVSRRELNDYAAGTVKSVRSTVFGLRDGLATLECNGGRQPSGLRMADGTLWFPTQGGIAIVDPRAIRKNHTPPPVLIEAVRVQGDPVSFRHGVVAGPRQDHVEIRYTALSFIKPEQVRFRYRLVGLDDEWTDAGDRRTTAFYRLPPGRYTFEVIAANSDGTWNRSGDRVAIAIEAPVWQRSWFLASVTLAVAALIVGLERTRSARQRRQRERQRVYARQLIETQEGERRRISNDLHDSLGQSLLLIRAEARAAGDEDRPASRALETIAGLAGQAYADLKEIAYDLRPYQLDKIGVSRTIQGLVRRIDGSCGIAFDADIADIDGVVPAGSAIDVYRIVQEGVSNVLRHSGASRARVAIRRHNGAVEIEIADDGCGFHPATRPVRSSASSFGLMGIEERARSLNGRLSVRASPGRGTTLVVRFTPRRSVDG